MAQNQNCLKEKLNSNEVNKKQLNSSKNFLFINEQTSFSIEKYVKYFKISLIFLILSTSSIFFLALLNINSEYFKAQSYLLIVLGICLLAVTVYIFKIFSNKQAHVRTKKLSIIFLNFICFCVAVVSLTYLIRVYAINWCGFVITFNGPVSEFQIKNTLSMNAICLETSYEEKLVIIRNVIFQLCNNDTSCQQNSFQLTTFIWIFSLCFANLFIFMVLDFYIFIYIYQKIHYAEFDASQKAQSIESLKKDCSSNSVSINIERLSQQININHQQDTSESQDFNNTRISQIEMTNADRADNLSENSGQIKIIHSINNQ
ncbi:hypothetical protein ABPG74_013483 [Tetrahymena malaccensis]